MNNQTSEMSKPVPQWALDLALLGETIPAGAWMLGDEVTPNESDIAWAENVIKKKFGE